MPKYSAQVIADYFLYKASQDNHELLSNLKLQKLVYYAQGIHLTMGEGPLFQDEIKAWKYGPAIPDLYQKYKEFGAGGIKANPNFKPESIDIDTSEFLDDIYNAFGQFSAIRLMELSHTDQCWKETGPNETISHDSMKDCLKKYLQK